MNILLSIPPDFNDYHHIEDVVVFHSNGHRCGLYYLDLPHPLVQEFAQRVGLKYSKISLEKLDKSFFVAIFGENDLLYDYCNTHGVKKGVIKYD